MRLTRDYYNNLTVPDFVLCKANRERIGVIPCTEKTVDFNFGELDEINFKTYYMTDGEINPVYKDIEVMKYVLVPEVGFFYIKTCNTQSEGTEHEYKSVKGQSIEGLLGQKYLENFLINTGETGSKELEIDETGETHIHIYLPPSQKATGRMDLFDYVLEKCPDWYVAHCDPALLVDERSHRSFNIDRKDVYGFITSDIQDSFECYVIFDTLNLDSKGRCGIYIYAQENYHNDTDIFVSYDNLLQSTDITADTDDIKTCVVLKGQDELEIREINFGYDRLYNFDYYNNTDFWSKKLYKEYNAWFDKTYDIGRILYQIVKETDTFDPNTTYYICENEVDYVVDSTVTAANFAEKVAEGLFIKMRNPNVYTDDIPESDLAEMSYLNLYEYRLRKYLELNVDLDDIMNHTSEFVNDADRGVGSGEFPVFNDAGEEIGSIIFEQDIGAVITQKLPDAPPSDRLNYIYIIKNANLSASVVAQIQSDIAKLEQGKVYGIYENPPVPYVEKDTVDKLKAYKTSEDLYSSFFDFDDDMFYSNVKVIDTNGLNNQVAAEKENLNQKIRTFRAKYEYNRITRREETPIDYTEFNMWQARLSFLERLKRDNYIKWIHVRPSYGVKNDVAQQVISVSDVYNTLLTPTTHNYYIINNFNQYQNQLNSDITSKKHEYETAVANAKVAYPGYKIYRWFDNTKTQEFVNVIVSVESSYKTTGSISVADATALRDFNPLYNTCLIIGSTYVTITDVDAFEEYLEADSKEQRGLIAKFPRSTWFNTNDWQGYGYSELQDTWALVVDQELAVLRKDNKGTVPDAYKEQEVTTADLVVKADSTADEKSAWYYFAEYLPTYLKQLAIEEKISSLDKQINGYDTYPYTINSKGSVNFNNLPSTANLGDTYSVTSTFTLDGVSYPKGTNVTWDGSKWVATSTIVVHIPGLQDEIDNESEYKAQVVDEIALDNNLSEDCRIELSAFIREEELSSDNFLVTDTMTEEERQEMLQSFIEYGKKELSKVCVPQLSFSASIADLFTIPEFDQISFEFYPGYTINVSLRDDYYVKATLLNVHVNYYDPSDFSIKFSDVLKRSEGLYTDIQDALNTATSAATSVAIGSSTWTSAAELATKINSTLEDGLLSQGAYLADNPDKSTFNITDIGIFVDTASGDYGKYDVFGEEKSIYDSIYMGGGRILFTDDGWKHVRMSLGRSKVKRIYTNGGTAENEEFGVFADFCIAGYVAGSQICGGELFSDAFVNNNPVTYFNLEEGTFTIRNKNTGNEVMKFNGQSLILGGDTSISWDSVTGTGGVATKDYVSDNFVTPGQATQITKDTVTTSYVNALNVTATEIKGKKIVGYEIDNGNGTFHVDANGTLTATAATIKGVVEADNGSIGNWSISNGGIGNGSTILNSDGSIILGNTIISSNNSGWLTITGTTDINNLECSYFKCYNTIDVNNINCAAINTNNSGITCGNITSIGALYAASYITAGGNLTVYGNSTFDDWIHPAIDETYPCGTTNYKWSTVWAKNGSINTSDRNCKNTIEDISERYEKLFFRLSPKTYKFNNGDRTHVGIISQDLEEEMIKLKIDSLDFGGFCKDEKGKYDDEGKFIPTLDKDGNPEYSYGIRYSEFVMLNTHMLQKAYKRIEALEAEIERIKNA